VEDGEQLTIDIDDGSGEDRGGMGGASSLVGASAAWGVDATGERRAINVQTSTGFSHLHY